MTQTSLGEISMGGNYTVTYCVFQIHAPPMILNSDIYFFLVTACLAGCYCFSMSADRPLSEPEIALYSFLTVQGHTVFLKSYSMHAWDHSVQPSACMQHTVVLLSTQYNIHSQRRSSPFPSFLRVSKQHNTAKQQNQRNTHTIFP